MPKPTSILSIPQLESLRDAVSRTAGFSVHTIADCERIHFLMKNRGHAELSASSLYRFFLQDLTSYRPYQHTLERLAHFAGWNSIMEFESESTDPEGNDRGLLFHCVRMGEWEGLFRYFEVLPEQMSANKVRQLVWELFLALDQPGRQNERFFKRFAAHPNFRRLFFESAADPEFRLPAYEKGLLYYVQEIPTSIDRFAALQERMFAQCLLFRHYVVTRQQELARTMGKSLFSDTSIDVHLHRSIHFFPSSRWKAYRFVYLHLYGNQLAARNYLDELFSYAQVQALEADAHARQTVLYNLLDACFMAEADSSVLLRFCSYFSSLLPASLQQTQDWNSLMHFLEPNGLKRLFTAHRIKKRTVTGTVL
jgi:hypothetical protein